MARGLRALLAVAGTAALGLGALQFTGLPWKAFSHLAQDGMGTDEGWRPTHILVLGGSGIPGESALMRLWYAAEAARVWTEAPVWMALPCDANDGTVPSARSYAAELESRGVAPGRCAARGCGRNTREQAVALVRDLEGDGGARILVVTSPEHVRRACGAIRHAAREAGAEVEVRGRPAFPLSIDDPPRTGTEDPGKAALTEEAAPAAELGSGQVVRYEIWNNAQYTLDAMREYVALSYYRARGWI